MATPVMSALVPRYQQHHAAVAGSSALVDSLPRSTIPTSQLKQVHFIPVSLQPTPRRLVLRAGTTLSFVVSDATRAHKSSSKLASEHASRVLQTEVQAILCGHMDEHTLVYAIPWEGTSTDPELQWMTIQDVIDEQLQLFMSLAICTSFSFAPPPCELRAI